MAYPFKRQILHTANSPKEAVVIPLLTLKADVFPENFPRFVDIQSNGETTPRRYVAERQFEVRHDFQ